MLLEPTEKYIKHIETSEHYLNDPKHMFNDDLHGLGRLQGINAVEIYLKHYGHKKPRTTAQYVMDNIVSIPYPKFSKLNPNTYIDKDIRQLSARCQQTHNRLNREYERMAEEEKKSYGWLR